MYTKIAISDSNGSHSCRAKWLQMMKNLWPCHSCLIIFGFWILTLELIYQIQIIFSCNLSHFWNQHHWKPRINISHYLLWWYVSLSPPPLFTPGHALWGSHFILNKKLTSFLKSPLLKILELLYQIVFSGFNPPAPLAP